MGTLKPTLGLSRDVGVWTSGFERGAHPTTETFPIEPRARQTEADTYGIPQRHD